MSCRQRGWPVLRQWQQGAQIAMDYKRPPITECVVEFRFSDQLEFEAIQKRVDKFKRFYPNEIQNLEFTGEFSDQGFKGSQQFVGVRLSTSDELQILMINRTNFIVSQLAPYTGWEEFSRRVRRDVEMFIDHFGRRTFDRVGMRYINRIDIPLEKISVETYLNIYPKVPSLPGEAVSNAFALTTTQTLADRRLGVTLQSASTESPVPKALSFVLDIDVFKDVEIPKRTDQIVELLETMRATKNEVFEASITPETRELFA